MKLFRYYGSRSASDYKTLDIFYEYSENRYCVHLKGAITVDTFSCFEKYMEDFLDDHRVDALTLDLEHLVSICSKGAKYLFQLRQSGTDLRFINVGYECEVSLLIENLGDCLDHKSNIETLDISGCKVLGEGANGKIYRINDEIVAKVYKKEGYYDDMMTERQLLRNALIVGVAAPFSFGYAWIEGKMALLMELVDSASFLEVIKSKNTDYNDLIHQYARQVIALHTNPLGDHGDLLPYHTYQQSVLKKADGLDPLISPKNRGRARRILEGIDAPDALIHGDIQPGNVMFSGNNMIFIDFDTFCVDKPIYDLAGLYNALFLDFIITDNIEDTLLKIPLETAEKIWDSFISIVYADKDSRALENDLKYIKLIAYIRYSHILKKRNKGEKDIKKCLELYEKCLDEF